MSSTDSGIHCSVLHGAMRGRQGLSMMTIPELLETARRKLTAAHAIASETLRIRRRSGGLGVGTEAEAFDLRVSGHRGISRGRRRIRSQRAEASANSQLEQFAARFWQRDHHKGQLFNRVVELPEVVGCEREISACGKIKADRIKRICAGRAEVIRQFVTDVRLREY